MSEHGTYKESSPAPQTTRDLLAKISLEKRNDTETPSTSSTSEVEPTEPPAAETRAKNTFKPTGADATKPELTGSPSEPKKVRSFSSYMSNVEKRKQELADQEKLKKEQEEADAQRKREEAERLVIEQQERESKERQEREQKVQEDIEEKERQRQKLEGLEKERERFTEQEELRKVEFFKQEEDLKAKEAAIEEVEKIKVEKDQRAKEAENPKEIEHGEHYFEPDPIAPGLTASSSEDVQIKDADSVSKEDIKGDQNLDIPKSPPEDPLQGGANNSPLSSISSELSIIPSSISNEKSTSNSNVVDIPPSIPETENSNLSRFHDSDAGSPEKSSRDEDSDAETVHGNSPIKPRRGRLVRKSELDSTPTSVRKVEFEDSEDEDEDDFKKRRPHSRSMSHSRSVSPNTKLCNSKKRSGRDSSGRSKLQKACEKGKYEEAKRLIDEGADIDDADYAGNTPLLEAALNGHTDCVELLLENGADVDLQSGPDDLDTALIDAVSNRHYDTVRVLLEYGGDPRIENAIGENALDVLDMEDEESETMIRLLREATMKLQQQDKERQSRSAVNSDREDGGRYRSRSRSRANPPQRRKHTMIFPDLTSKSGRNEIYERASEGDIEFVGTYLSNGGKPDSEALALAARYGHTDVVNLFLGFGGKVDTLTKKGMTPLMTTVGRGHLETVKLLVQAGADPTKKSKEGKNALDYALSSLIVADDEIEFLKESAKKMGKDLEASEKQITFTGNELKIKKRKASSTTEVNEYSPEAKKKKLLKAKAASNDETKSKSRVVERKPESNKEFRAAKEQKVKPKTEVKENPKLEAKEKPKPETIKRVASGGIAYTNPTQRKVSAPAPHSETEEEKQTRLLKEKEEQRLREEYEAKRLAKQKAREQQFLNNFETEEKRKEEELQKLAQLEEERKLALKKEEEERQKLEAERKAMMSQQEEREKRLKLRESYPYGLRIATFDNNRTGEEILQYLPLYYTEIDGLKYAIDIQVILILGFETFRARYKNKLYTPQKLISLDDKKKIFNFLYPFLGNFNTKSTTAQVENMKEEFDKFKKLEVSWVKYEALLEIVKSDYPKLNTVVQAHTQFLDYESLVVNPTFDTPFVRPEIQRNVSTSAKSATEVAKEQEAKEIAEFAKALPWSMRAHTGLVKGLFRSKKQLW